MKLIGRMKHLWRRFSEKTARLREYMRFRRRTRAQKGTGRDGEKSALVVFKEVVVPRKLYQVTTLLRTSGYRVYVRIGLREYLRYNYIGRLIFNHENIYMVKGPLPAADVLVLDAEDAYEVLPDQKVLLTDYRFFPPDHRFFEENCFFPIMYHPRLMSRENYRMAGDLSEKDDRKILALFAGNLDPERYDNEVMRKRFGIDTRSEVIGWITGSELIRKRVYRPDSFDEFVDAMNLGELLSRIVIMDTRRCQIPQQLWLDTLSEVRYFITVPGLTHPFCHNMAESMSVGAVPVLQYPDFFYPVLRDGETCFSFRTREDLEQLLLGMTDTGDVPGWDIGLWKQMRRNVTVYHQRFLSPGGFKTRMEEFLTSDKNSIRLIMARRIPGS